MDGSQDVCLFSRKKMELTGIEEVESFTDELITVASSLGMIAVDGRNLKIESFSTGDGNLRITGEIDSVSYYAKREKQEKSGFFSRLTK
ncbi:MAG: YabP/YqfC family sporulation protein [Clostridia bacterium]|nr:YabP/YqfC family sporulation protein [Clostridia bacterium]MBQ8369899.1 YabP/YqfC family sporulation protein [Clostridia bacterium]MBQ8512024.1 YabP/YqfC family sporulation protein [Clostridia bacterium]